jgi:hypothetical protein
MINSLFFNIFLDSSITLLIDNDHGENGKFENNPGTLKCRRMKGVKTL